jgi:ADP-heptose:LPS heptosyltransferase
VDLGQVDDSDAKFVQTAAIMSLLDAVVCIDSSVTHLAGALGKPAFILLGMLADPQWGVDRSGSARWYPSLCVRRAMNPDVRGLKNHREITAEMWADVVWRVRDELEGIVNDR